MLENGKQNQRIADSTALGTDLPAGAIAGNQRSPGYPGLGRLRVVASLHPWSARLSHGRIDGSVRQGETLGIYQLTEKSGQIDILRHKNESSEGGNGPAALSFISESPSSN